MTVGGACLAPIAAPEAQELKARLRANGALTETLVSGANIAVRKQLERAALGTEGEQKEWRMASQQILSDKWLLALSLTSPDIPVFPELVMM